MPFLFGARAANIVKVIVNGSQSPAWTHAATRKHSAHSARFFRPLCQERSKPTTYPLYNKLILLTKGTTYLQQRDINDFVNRTLNTRARQLPLDGTYFPKRKSHKPARLRPNVLP